MQYLGSKKSIAKHLLPIILRNRTKDQYFVDLFCGGCNLLDSVDGLRIGNDINYYLISMWRALQNGWEPPDVLSKEEYYDIKKNQNNKPPELVAFAGFLCSFGGKWFGGYAKNSKNDNYCLRGKKSLLKQIQKLKDVQFENQQYFEVKIPENSIIYCDIPYKGTTKYKDSFDHEKFWKWAEEKSKTNELYVSEYSAPPNWKCILEINVKTKLDKNSQYDRVEKLFKYE